MGDVACNTTHSAGSPNALHMRQSKKAKTNMQHLGYIAAVREMRTCALQTVQAAEAAIRRRVGLGCPLKPMLLN